MKKTVLFMLKQNVPFYILCFFFVLGFGLFGTILFELIMRRSVVTASENPQTFEMAFLLSLVAFMAGTFLFSLLAAPRNFQAIVSMSRTRKSFFAGSLLCSFASALSCIAALSISAATEQLRLRHWWRGYSCESHLLASFTPAVLLFSIFAFIVFSQFTGALFLRFGKLAFWTIWTAWMIGSFFIPRVMDDLEEERQTVFSLIGRAVLQVFSALPFFVWLLLGTGILCGLLFLSYRMFLRQQITA